MENKKKPTGVTTEKAEKKPSEPKPEKNLSSKNTDKKPSNNNVKKGKVVAKKIKKPWYKDVRSYFVGVLFVLAIALLFQAYTVKVIPIKYIMVVGVVLLGIVALLWWLQYGKNLNKLNKLLGKVLVVIVSCLLMVGNVYLYKAGNTIGKISGLDEETDSVSIIVMKDSSVRTLDDLKTSAFGANEQADRENVKETLDDINTKIGQGYEYQTYANNEELAKALYTSGINAMILNEAYRGTLENAYPKFDDETRVIYTHEITRKTEDISKNVNVTNTPFNLYISGIDTYGPVSTKSRSDVNMIATVNPLTHQIVLTSIPRDYYIAQTCQAGQKDKLTHTGMYGVECTVTSVEDYFGLEINYYARVNFTSVIDIVNALGGIEVNSPIAFYASDGSYYYSAGDQHMDGEMALRFARERYNLPDGDRDRGKNQMRVLTGMINKAISPAIITNYSSIMNAVGGSFQTNMSSDEITSLISMQLNTMAGWEIIQQAVTGPGQYIMSPANGFESYMMIPNVESVNAATEQINAVLNAK